MILIFTSANYSSLFTEHLYVKKFGIDELLLLNHK